MFDIAVYHRASGLAIRNIRSILGNSNPTSRDTKNFYTLLTNRVTNIIIKLVNRLYFCGYIQESVAVLRG